MNKYVTYGLIFIGGVGIGGGLGWFLTKTHYENVMDAEISSQVEETRKWYIELINQTEKELRKEWEADDDSTDVSYISEGKSASEKIDDSVSYTEMMNRRKEDLLRPERIRYETFSKPENDSEPVSTSQRHIESEDKEVDEVLLKHNDDDPRSDIYVISSEQFAHERYGYDKVTLFWWELERILSEEDMAILDVPDILGMNWENHIGEDERDVVYVRNEPLETDYEVQVRHESYYEMRE